MRQDSNSKLESQSVFGLKVNQQSIHKEEPARLLKDGNDGRKRGLKKEKTKKGSDWVKTQVSYKQELAYKRKRMSDDQTYEAMKLVGSLREYHGRNSLSNQLQIPN